MLDWLKYLFLWNQEINIAKYAGCCIKSTCVLWMHCALFFDTSLTHTQHIVVHQHSGLYHEQLMLNVHRTRAVSDGQRRVRVETFLKSICNILFSKNHSFFLKWRLFKHKFTTHFLIIIQLYFRKIFTF